MLQILSTLAASLFVITGGPSVGKTSIIKELEDMGEIICEEAATDIIATYQKNGILHPWEMDNFEVEVYLEKVRREKESLYRADMLDKPFVFADRGLLDTLVYLETNNKLETNEYEHVSGHLSSLDLSDYYEAVFFVEPHSGKEFIAEQGGVRHEDTNEAIRLGEEVRKVYQKAGIPTIVVPPYMTPKERAEYVLDKLAHLREQK